MSMKNGFLWISTLALTLGCATLPADELVARGEFEAAVPAYEAALKEHPDDAGLRRRYDASRQRLLESIARRSQAASAAGDHDTARAAALDVVSRFEAWGGQPVSARPLVAERSAWLRQELDGAFEVQLAKRAPLRALLLVDDAGNARLWGNADLGARRERAVSAGRAQCETARARAASIGPYAQHVAARYCGLFGVETAALPPLPDRFGGVAVDAKLKGAGAELTTAIQDELVEAFRRSAWFEPEGSDALAVDVSGVLLEIRQVTWTDVRVVTRQVPYTTSETYTYTCGKSTCTGSRPVTRHRSETYLERTVRQRLEFLEVGMPTPPPVECEQVIGHAARLTARFAPPVELSVVAEPLRQMGAAEASQRSSAREGIRREAHQLGQRAETLLWRTWKEAYCLPDQKDAELAARCIFGAPHEPQGGALAELFGGDVTARPAPVD